MVVVNQNQSEMKPMFNKAFLTEVSEAVSYENFETFFEMEAELFSHLFELEKEKAQKIGRRIVSCLLQQSDREGHSTAEKLKCIQYYLLTLSAIFTRHLVQQHLTPGKAIAFNGLCYQFVGRELTEENASYLSDELIELFTYALTERAAPNLRHKTVNEVISYINDEIESDLTVEGIANRFNLSTSHLSRIFHEHTEITLVEYINVRKVEEAQYHLRFSEKKISDISDQFHFCNQSYFTRIFKKYTGETPRRFRFNTHSEYFRFDLPEVEKQSLGDESL